MFDLNGGYSFGNNYSLRFGIDNLFDKKPPVTNANEFQNGNNTNSGFYDVLGRRFFLGLQMSF